MHVHVCGVRVCGQRTNNAQPAVVHNTVTANKTKTCGERVVLGATPHHDGS